jgi:rod shape-determining protein MreB
MRVLNPFVRLRLALDVGTAATRACSHTSQVIESASVVREDDGTASLRRSALRGGVVCDIAAAANVIQSMVRRLAPRWGEAGAIVTLPTDVSPSEREALVEAVTEAGATVIALVPEPLAAAIGAGVDVSSEYASLVADLGDGVCDAAVIRDGRIVRSRALRVGCSDARGAIVDWLSWHRGLAVDDDVADRVLREYCRNVSLPEISAAGIAKGGAARTERVGRDDLAVLIDPVAGRIASFLAAMLREMPDREAEAARETGIHLTGGGALLGLFVRRIEMATGLRAVVGDDPLWSVIAGAREMLGNGTVAARATS